MVSNILIIAGACFVVIGLLGLIFRRGPESVPADQDSGETP